MRISDWSSDVCSSDLPAEDITPNGWRAVTQIVLDGTFFCSQELHRRRLAAGGSGAILNIGATFAWTGGPGSAHSAAAKAAVTNLTQTLGVERSQEHTSELQSLMRISYAVFCLKKNNQRSRHLRNETNNTHTTYT